MWGDETCRNGVEWRVGESGTGALAGSVFTAHHDDRGHKVVGVLGAREAALHRSGEEDFFDGTDVPHAARGDHEVVRVKVSQMTGRKVVEQRRAVRILTRADGAGGGLPVELFVGGGV